MSCKITFSAEKNSRQKPPQQINNKRQSTCILHKARLIKFAFDASTLCYSWCLFFRQSIGHFIM